MSDTDEPIPEFLKALGPDDMLALGILLSDTTLNELPPDKAARKAAAVGYHERIVNAYRVARETGWAPKRPSQRGG